MAGDEEGSEPGGESTASDGGPPPSDEEPAASGEEPPASDEGSTASDERQEMAAAIREIRREGWKAAALQSVVEATAVFLAVNLLLVALAPDWLPGSVALPSVVADPLTSVADWHAGTLALPGSATVAGGVALVALVAGVWLRVRRPVVERFEAVNPPVAEALRTARDAVDDGADSRMARRLYGTVLDRLRESSSLGLVDGKRLGATAAVVVVLSLATLQVAVVDLALLDGQSPGDEGPDSDRVRNFTGLQDPEGILGAREDVSAGDETLTARVESTGGGREVENDRQFPADRTGPGSDGVGSGIDGQQAGFAEPERVEDAALVREYNRRIRQDSGDEANGDDADGDDEN